MMDVDSLATTETSMPPPRSETRATLHAALIAAGAALLGALIGGGITAYVQFSIEDKQNAAATEQRRRDRAEEIVTLVARTPVTYLAEKKAMMQDPAHVAVPSNDAERVTALVALYFPDANEVVRAYESACAVQSEMLSEIAIAMIQHSPLPDDSHSYQNTMATGDIVTEKVLGDVGVKYTRRVPVTVAR